MSRLTSDQHASDQRASSRPAPEASAVDAAVARHRRPGSQRPGGRTARVRAAVLDATLSALAEHGYAALTVDVVAARSGVHKATIYRRWGGVDGLLADALERAAQDDWRPPDTGSLTGDLRALNRVLLADLTDPHQGAVPAAVISAAFQSPRAAEALHAFYIDRYRRCAVIVERAMARGELPAVVDGDELLRFATAPVFHRLFITRDVVDTALADRAADAAVAAAQAGVFTL